MQAAIPKLSEQHAPNVIGNHLVDSNQVLSASLWFVRQIDVNLAGSSLIEAESFILAA